MLVPWERLSEDLKESNLRQADRVGAKLQAIGGTVTPLADWDAEDFRFTDLEVELLARREHEDRSAVRHAPQGAP